MRIDKDELKAWGLIIGVALLFSTMLITCTWILNK